MLSSRHHEPQSARQQPEQRRPSTNKSSNSQSNSRPGASAGAGYQTYQQQQYQQEQPDYMDTHTPSLGSVSRTSYQNQPTGIPVPISNSKGPASETSGYKAQQAQNESYPSSQAYSNGQGYIAAPPRSASTVSNNEHYNNNAVNAPSQIIYRGHKMVAHALLDEKDKEMKSLETANKNMGTKVAYEI